MFKFFSSFFHAFLPVLLSFIFRKSADYMFVSIALSDCLTKL